jgi:Metalloenzyme superfamily
LGGDFADIAGVSDVAEFLDLTIATQRSAGRGHAPRGSKLSTLVTHLLQRCHVPLARSILVKSKVEAGTGGSRIGRQLQRLALTGAAFTVTSCIALAPRQHADQVSRAVQQVEQPVAIVIVTLDGVRWHEVFEGVDAELAKSHDLPSSAVVSARELLPNLYAIIDSHGAALGAPGHGASISASGPNFLSLPGYAELLSGRRVTGCDDNQCRGLAPHTIIEELSASSTLDRADVAAVTSWTEIARVTSHSACSAAISSGRRGGVNRELFARDAEGARLLAMAENAPRGIGDSDFRADALTADLAIHHLKTHAPRFLFLGLGEPDEFGHLNDYAGYLEALRRADARIAEIDGELQRLAARGTRTALFITADHGRADTFVNHGEPYPESARVWLVASGSALGARGFVTAPRERRLADLAPTMREIAHLPRDIDVAAGAPLSELLGSTSL